MTMSAALDSGLAFSLLVVFFGFIYPGWMDNFKWWGTEVYKQASVSHSLVNLDEVLIISIGLRLAGLLIQERPARRSFRTTLSLRFMILLLIR